VDHAGHRHIAGPPPVPGADRTAGHCRLADHRGLAAALVGLLAAAGFVRAFVPVALGLTTTALGTLLPILRDNDLLHGRFGRYLLAAGAVGGCSRSSPSPCSWGPTKDRGPGSGAGRRARRRLQRRTPVLSRPHIGALATQTGALTFEERWSGARPCDLFRVRSHRAVPRRNSEALKTVKSGEKPEVNGRSLGGSAIMVCQGLTACLRIVTSASCCRSAACRSKAKVRSTALEDGRAPPRFATQSADCSLGAAQVMNGMSSAGMMTIGRIMSRSSCSRMWQWYM
jgi:hypothetical protein